MKAKKQITSQLFPTCTVTPNKPTIWANTSLTKQWEKNVLKIHMLIAEYFMFPATGSTGLVNVFANQRATPEQTHDHLNARKVGGQRHVNDIAHHILQLLSVVKAWVRCKHLLTMAPPNITKNAYHSNKRSNVTPINTYEGD